VSERTLAAQLEQYTTQAELLDLHAVLDRHDDTETGNPFDSRGPGMEPDSSAPSRFSHAPPVTVIRRSELT
jgi:hypothetical protein